MSKNQIKITLYTIQNQSLMKKDILKRALNMLTLLVGMTTPCLAQNVGIGTTTPEQKLHVAGSLFVTDNVGIGVKMPEFKLDVGGRMRIRSGGTDFTSAGVWFNNSINTTTSAFVGMANDNTVGFFGAGVGRFALSMNTNSGNVDITGNLSVVGIRASNNVDIAGNLFAVGVRASGNVAVEGSLVASVSVAAIGDVIAGGAFDMGLEYPKTSGLLQTGTSNVFTCNCPSGKKVLGGGGGQDLFVLGGNLIIVNFSKPKPDGSGWTVMVTNNDPVGQHLIEAWAICGKVK
jgi:hypothetical protein